MTRNARTYKHLKQFNIRAICRRFPGDAIVGPLACLLLMVSFLMLPLAHLSAAEPSEKELRARFTLEIPGEFELADFDVEASSNYGTDVEPLVKQRFSATVRLRADTFALEKQEGPVTWIVPVAKVGGQRVVYGVATSTRKGGAWQTSFALEGGPLSGMGQPLSAFPGRAIVRGTGAETEFVQEVARQAEARQAAEHQAKLAARQREEQLREQERQAEISRLQHIEKVNEAQRQAKEKKEAEAKAEEVEQLKALAEQARKALAVQLPGFWQIKEFATAEAVKEGTPERLSVTQRFSAVIETAKDTFQEAAREGAITFVTPVAKAGEQRRIEGTMDALLSSGTWSTRLKFQSPAAVGQPVDSFPGRAIVAGSAQEKEYRDQEKDRELAARQREEQLREQERQAELSRLQHQVKVTDAQRIVKEKKAAEERDEENALLAKLAEQARKQLAQQLPPYWQVKDFSAADASRKGASPQAGYQQKFTAVIQLAADTFQQTEKQGVVTLLTRLAKAGEQRRFFGTIDSTLSGVQWATKLEFANPTVQAIGQPLDFYSGRIIIVGSAEEREYRQQVQQQELTKRQNEEQLREQERQAELAKLAHAKKLQEEKEKAELARIAAEAKRQEEVARQEAQQKAEAAKRREQELAALQTALSSQDVGARQATIDTALRSGDQAKQNLAIKGLLNSTKQVSGHVQFADGQRIYETTPFLVLLEKFDAASGTFSGQLQGTSAVVSGSVQGTRLSLAGKGLSIGVQLDKDGSMTGSASGCLPDELRRSYGCQINVSRINLQ